MYASPNFPGENPSYSFSIQTFWSKDLIVLIIKKNCVSSSIFFYDKPETTPFYLLLSLNLIISNILSNQILFCTSIIYYGTMEIWEINHFIFHLYFAYSNSSNYILQISPFQRTNFQSGYQIFFFFFNLRGNNRTTFLFVFHFFVFLHEQVYERQTNISSVMKPPVMSLLTFSNPSTFGPVLETV